MARMLLRELTFVEQMALASLCQHAGFEVLTKLLDEACVEASKAPIILDPVKTERYEEKLVELTRIARVTNEIVGSIRKTIEVHISAAVAQQHQQELDAQIDDEAEKVLGTLRLIESQEE